MEKFLEIYKTKINLILTLIGVFLLVLIIFLVSLTLNIFEERKYISEPNAMINVSGEGSVLAVPDIAEFSFSVRYEDDEVSKAQGEVAKRVNEIVSFLKEEGVEDRYIKTIGYTTRPRYEWQSSRVVEDESSRVLVGYEVIQTTEVMVKDMEIAGSLVGGVGDRGATDISGLTFSVEDEEELKRESRKKAIEEAKTKAKDLAIDLDVSLVRIVDFSERDVHYPNFMRTDMIMEDSVSGEEPSFEPGEEEIKTNVQIKYEIR